MHSLLRLVRAQFEDLRDKLMSQRWRTTFVAEEALWRTQNICFTSLQVHDAKDLATTLIGPVPGHSQDCLRGPPRKKVCRLTTREVGTYQ